MARKGGKYKRKENSVPRKEKAIPFHSDDEDTMNDEIDAFHKQRDVVAMRLDEGMEESDDDGEQSVFNIEDEEADDDEEEDDEIDNPQPKGFIAKCNSDSSPCCKFKCAGYGFDVTCSKNLQRSEKFVRAQLDGVDDENFDDPHEEEKKVVWSSNKYNYGADVGNEPLSSDDEDAVEEEAEVLKLQSERAKALSMEDYGLEDTGQDVADAEPTLEEIFDQGKPASRPSLDKVMDDMGLMYEVVQKDLNYLTKEEQMDVVYSSAPELVGLLSELNDALKQLENKINPLVNKIREQESAKKVVMHYIEVKQLLLLSFCQAITFYLLLKTEGQPVRDHPVVSRLVEIKSLLDKMKELDENLPFEVEDNVSRHVNHAAALNLAEKPGTIHADSINKEVIASATSSIKNSMVELDEKPERTEFNTTRCSKNIESQQKRQDIVGVESLEMLKVRAALDEKLKQKGVLNSPKQVRRTKHLEPVNGQLETLNDFDDEARELGRHTYGKSNGDENKSSLSKLSQQLYIRPNKRKVFSGDDDIPKRDDIGERRRKHELRVLAGAGVTSVDNLEDATGNLSSDVVSEANGESDHDPDPDPDLEYYKQVEQQHAAKLAAKSNKYSRIPEVSSLPNDTVDGKRLITNQMEKNRGLTRTRKKLIKNPRKKYKLKHKKAMVSRKGQVREVIKPTGPYGGEVTGINSGISRSIRFKS